MKMYYAASLCNYVLFSDVFINILIVYNPHMQNIKANGHNLLNINIS